MSYVIVSGFGDFREIEANPSWKAVKKLPDTVSTNDGRVIEIVKWKLRVAYQEVDVFYSMEIPRIVKEKGLPLAVIHCGVAASNISIHLEKCAYNKTKGLDVDGKVPPTGKIEQSRELEFRRTTTLSDKLKQIAKIIESKTNARTVESIDPGRYLCNYVFYKGLQSFEGETVPCLFIHVPQENKPYSIEKLSECINVCITEILQS